jgi:predicted DCC family thiol-disulfide oxidoreductase YuxK
MRPHDDRHLIVLFDGVCNLCNGAVNFVIDRDPRGRFLFAALQSEAARPLISRVGLPEGWLGGLVLIEGDAFYVGSTAILRIAKQLGGGWPLLYSLIVIPRPVRDAIYGWIIRRRYRWFGKRDSCRVPTPELEAHFLQ